MAGTIRMCSTIAATGLVAAVLALPNPAAAMQPTTQAAVAGLVTPSGQLPRPINSRSLPKAPAHQRVTFYWGLQRSDSAAANLANQVSNPSSGSYRRFPTAGTVARRFGASAATTTTVKKYLQGKHLRGVVDASRLFMRVKGSVGQFERAFHRSVGTAVEGGVQYWAPTRTPRIPRRISKLAPDRIWLSQRQLGGSKLAESGLPGTPRTATPPGNKGTVVGCAKIRNNPDTRYYMTVGQGDQAYGINSLRLSKRAKVRGDIRARHPIGIIAQGSGFSNKYLGQARQCLGFKTTAHHVETDGISQLPSGGEGNLDVQMVLGSLAKGYRVPVYESTGDKTAFLAPVAALNSRTRPSVLTSSYGQCEQEVSSAVRRLSDAIYLRLGLVGTSVLVASGDRGSSGCIDNETGKGPTKRAVSYPSTSPWVTAVGGTRIVLNKANNRVAEYAWNDSPWGNETAGGGGSSIFFGRPSWQKRSQTRTNRRSVPDLSAHASGAPGWAVFGVGVVSGTSAATPLVASGVALLNEKLARDGQAPMGPLNPWLYQLPRKATYDITVGNTDLHNNGCCTARKGYDQATGIGSPNFSTWRKSVRRVR